MTEFLHAAVQYDDWKGTAAADNTEFSIFRAYLISHNLLSQGEFLVGITLNSSLLHDSKTDVTITALITESRDFDSFAHELEKNKGPKIFKRVVPVSFTEFLSLFKRFSIVLTTKGVQIDTTRLEEAD